MPTEAPPTWEETQDVTSPDSPTWEDTTPNVESPAAAVYDTVQAATRPLDILTNPAVVAASHMAAERRAAAARVGAMYSHSAEEAMTPAAPAPDQTNELAKGVGRAFNNASQALLASVSDVGQQAVNAARRGVDEFGRPIGRADLVQAPPVDAGEPPSNIEAFARGEPLPAETQARVLPPALRGPLAVSQGLVKGVPRLAAFAALEAAGVPPVIAGPLVFAPSEEEGISGKQALIAAVLPYAGRYAGTYVEALATKLGISSEAAAATANTLGGAAGATALVSADALNELRKLPPEKRGEAWAEVASNAAQMFLLGLSRGKSRPEDVATRLQRRWQGPVAQGAVFDPNVRYPIQPRSAEPVGVEPSGKFMRPEVPGTPAEPRMTVKEEIRAKDARTKKEIQALFPQLSNEEARQLAISVWGTGGDVGVRVSPTIPIPDRIADRPEIKAPPGAPPPTEFEVAENQRRQDEARAQAQQTGALDQQIITWERELDKALKTGDGDLQRQAIRRLMELRQQRDAVPAPAKRPITPKAPAPVIPRRAIGQEVPGTPAEPREQLTDTIRRLNARTVNAIREALGNPNLPKERAKEYGKAAWGEWPPPESEGATQAPPKFEETTPLPPKEEPPGEEPPPEEPPGPTVPKPPAPPAAPAAPAEEPPPTTLPANMDTVRTVAGMGGVEFFRQANKFNKINFDIGKSISAKEAAEVRKLLKQVTAAAETARAEGMAAKDIAKVNESGGLMQKAQFFSEILRHYDNKQWEQAGILAPKEGYVRLYHGQGGAAGAGEGGDFWTTNLEYARNFGKVSYVDVPQAVADAARAKMQKTGTGGPHLILDDEWVRQSKPMENQPGMKVTDVTPEETAAAAADPLASVSIAGRRLTEWMKATAPDQMPIGSDLSEMARRLGVDRDRRKVFQALQNEKRLRELFKPPMTAAEATPVPEAQAAKSVPEAAKAPEVPAESEKPATEVPKAATKATEPAPEPPPAETKPAAPKVAKGPDFEQYGNWKVTLPDGSVRYMFYDRDTAGGVWRESKDGKTDVGRILSMLNKQEAIDNLVKGESPIPSKAPPPAKPTEPKPPATPEEPGMGPGAASRREFELPEFEAPDPEVMGIKTGSRAYNRIEHSFKNFYQGIRQLFKRGENKQDLMQLANAADNLPRMAGYRARQSLELRLKDPKEANAVTFIMQALKMSGEGLPPERTAELEYAGNPLDYLKVRATDMETAAQEFLNKGQKLNAEAAKDAAEAMRFAAKNLGRLKPIASAAKAKFDAQIKREQRAGSDVNYEEWYVPQRHEIDLITSGDGPIVLGHARGATSTGFKKAKVFPDYASAIEAGFVPRTFNIGELLEHRVNQGERLLARRALFDRMGSMKDPVDGQPLAKPIPTRIITRPDGTIDKQESVPRDYVPHEVIPGYRVAVHKGYAPLMRALTATSQLSESAVFGALQSAAAVEKHLMLALDTFHASRTMQAELFLTGKLSIGERQRIGRALVEYDPKDLDLAVKKGEITQEMADYIRTPMPIEVGGKTVQMTPAALFQMGARNGLNFARFSDVLYKSWLKDIPITGPVNKWVFDKVTRSAMTQGFISEFQRVAKENPNLSATRVARQVASDINVLFGNLGKESIFKNPSVKAINQLLFLAPNWVEALARREARTVKQLGRAAKDIVVGRPTGRKIRSETETETGRTETLIEEMTHTPRLGTAAKGIGTGLAAYFAATQVLNLITRHHLTFSNPEDGHKLDAWIPDFSGKTKGFFISPLSVFGEITHDILRYAREKPDLWAAINQIGANKLGNFGRLLEVVASGRDPGTNEKLIGVGRRAMAAGAQMVPVPISLTQAGRLGASLIPGSPVSGPAPGAVQRQLAASAGFKTEPAGTAQRQIYAIADKWKSANPSPKIRAEVERRLKEDFGPSDYKDIRSALLRNDIPGARRAFDVLRETKEPQVIARAMRHPHPFTGSQHNERAFRATLSDDQKRLYQEALEERRQLYARYRQMLLTPTK
jgi:hypothetical protein